jgi:hypothetical protein
MALALSWLAMTFTQLALLMLALSPLIAASFGVATVLASIAPAPLLALIAWIACVRSWRSLLQTEREQPNNRVASGLELGPSDLRGR